MGISIGELRSLHDKLTRSQYIRAFYDKLPRTQLWGKQNHEVITQIIRDAADAQDLVHQMQRTPLFGINSDTDSKQAAVEWLVRKYESCGIGIESMAAEVEESPYTCPNICTVRAGRRLSVDFLRTVAIAHDIRHQLQQRQPPLHVVELGAGLGHLARTLRVFGVSKTQILLDLPETLIFSYAFLALNFPDASAIFITDPDQASSVRSTGYDFVFVPSCFAESLDFAGAELFVNTCSLGEMNNVTIRYWMDFVQRRMPVKYLFTQNRFLNTIDPSKQAWRWEENECSVHYDSSWKILKWDLEPPWYQCPYVAPLSARSLDIAATREHPQDSRAAAELSDSLLEEVKQEDWFRFADTAPDMTVRQNRFVTDVTMTGALFKLWESIRLRPTAEAVWVLLRYLETLIQNDCVAFEETPYYQELFLRLAKAHYRPEFEAYGCALRDRNAVEPSSGCVVVAETQDYNILSVDFRMASATGPSVAKKYYAIAKTLGPVDLFRQRPGGAAAAAGPVNLLRERLGEREFPGYLGVSDTLEAVMEKAKAWEEEQKARTEREPPEFCLEGDVDGYNIFKTQSGYVAVAQSLGPIDLLRERLGEREFPGYLWVSDTLESVVEKAKSWAHEDKARSEKERPEYSLEGDLDGYNIIRTPTGYLAVAQSLGPIDFFHERIGEKELAPVLLKASSYEEIRERITNQS